LVPPAPSAPATVHRGSGPPLGSESPSWTTESSLLNLPESLPLTRSLSHSQSLCGSLGRRAKKKKWRRKKKVERKRKRIIREAAVVDCCPPWIEKEEKEKKEKKMDKGEKKGKLLKCPPTLILFVNCYLAPH
jgi:hypothetical protein